MSASVPLFCPLHSKDYGVTDMHNTKPKRARTLAEQGQSAAAFLSRISALQPVKVTRQQTGLSETTIKNARNGALETAGNRVIQALSAAYGEAFDDFAYGLTVTAKDAAVEAQIAVLEAQIKALRDGE